MSKFGDFIKSTILKAATTLNPGVFGFFSNNSFPSMTEREQLKAYRGWVYACVNVIAQMVAQMDVRLLQKQGEDWKETKDQPILEILKRVNDWQSFFDLIFATEAYLQLDGNAYWYLVRNNKKEIVEIWNLDPTKMSVFKSKKDFVAGYSFMNETGVKIPLEVDEILHIYHFHPLNPYKGFGTVAAASMAIDTDTFAAEYQRNFFGNSAMPSAVLSTDKTLSQDQYDRIKGNWDARYKGVQNSSKLALLEAGLTFTPLNPTAKEMQFTEGRKNLRDEILAIFRVPKVILGITEDVNYAAAQATEYVFTKFVVKPEIQFIVSKLNEFLIPLFGLDTTKFKFAFTDPVPENQDQKRADRDSGIEHSYLTINEARDDMGLEPIDGGDVILASTMVMPLLGDGVDPNADRTGGNGAGGNDPNAKNVKKKFLIQKVKAARRNPFIRKQTVEQTKILRKLNVDLEKMLLGNLKQKSIGNVITKETANDLVHIIFENYQDWIGLLFDATKQGLKKVLEQSGKDALAEVNVDVEFDLQNPRALNWLNDHALEDTNSYSGTIKDEIALRIQEGMEMGASTDDIANSISEFFDQTSDYKAERLARTEVINAYNGGNLEGYRQSGVVGGKSWLPDDQACEVCMGNADDGVIGLDESFSSGDDQPTAHPNCLVGETVVASDGVKKIYNRLFEGKVLTLSIAGNDTTLTPNHPVLTDRGWTRARDLKVGDSVYQLVDWKAFMSNPDDNYVVAPIEEIYSSFRVPGDMPAVQVPVTTKDFHGDGIVDTKVDVIDVNGLKANDVSEFGKNRINESLGATHGSGVSLNGKGSTKLLSQGLSVSSESQVSSGNAPAPIGEGIMGSSKSMSITETSDLKSKSIKSYSEGDAGAPDSLSDIRSRFAGKIALVKISNIVVSKFSGHVYNLETKDGYYFANSIITHNCECSLQPENIGVPESE